MIIVISQCLGELACLHQGASTVAVTSCLAADAAHFRALIVDPHEVVE
jgi:hypothetical protein